MADCSRFAPREEEGHGVLGDWAGVEAASG
jgi:hypothetical protein